MKKLLTFAWWLLTTALTVWLTSLLFGAANVAAAGKAAKVAYIVTVGVLVAVSMIDGRRIGQ